MASRSVADKGGNIFLKMPNTGRVTTFLRMEGTPSTTAIASTSRTSNVIIPKFLLFHCFR